MFKIGDKCNWKNQPERLVYVGKYGSWHQFSLVEEVGKVWCEVLEEDLHYIELTESENKISTGWQELDDMIVGGRAVVVGGRARQELIAFVANSGVGKTRIVGSGTRFPGKSEMDKLRHDIAQLVTLETDPGSYYGDLDFMLENDWPKREKVVAQYKQQKFPNGGTHKKNSRKSK